MFREESLDFLGANPSVCSVQEGARGEDSNLLSMAGCSITLGRELQQEWA